MAIGIFRRYAAGPLLAMLALPAAAETPALHQAVADGALPPLEQRLPAIPRVVDLAGDGLAIGRHGGTLRSLIGKQKDAKLFAVYGYARLIGYRPDLSLAPDILRELKVEDGRVFTLRLRPGHKWSDGHPFTAEDFRYWWRWMANDEKLSPKGPPTAMLVDGEAPSFEIIDDHTVRYGWSRPNPFLLPRLAGASPMFIYRPAHYLAQFHARFADPQRLRQAVAEARVSDWAVIHHRRDAMYLSTNPALPTLQPWMVRTAPPSTRFIAERNPYFHRVDRAGRQLPYIDRLILDVVTPRLIAARASGGGVDLQARGLFFSDYTFLRESELSGEFRTLLWRKANGAQIALYPNLNVADPVWRKLLHDVRFRRALSLGIDRNSINEFLYFGLGREGNNTVLPESPLFKDDYRGRWARHDAEQAARLLDQIGLTGRDDDDIRLLPDGRPLILVVETAGEQSEQVDALELIEQDWREIGVKLLIKPSHRHSLRARVSAGQTVMSVWSGLENGVPTAAMNPAALAPSSSIDLHWPSWGLHEESAGQSGQAADLPAVRELLDLKGAWLRATEEDERRRIWHRMLEIHADQVFTIGLVSGVRQPVVVAKRLRNVPDEGLYNWDPGAFFGIYRPDTFWFSE
ncbi:MAG: ABC transporter substrate-binding protein [Alphaproteobacteria bacterium]|nr:ABC transporter substrate-binding protein [Alphaproteobacteria bacterium]